MTMMLWIPKKMMRTRIWIPTDVTGDEEEGESREGVNGTQCYREDPM